MKIILTPEVIEALGAHNRALAQKGDRLLWAESHLLPVTDPGMPITDKTLLAYAQTNERLAYVFPRILERYGLMTPRHRDLSKHAKADIVEALLAATVKLQPEIFRAILHEIMPVRDPASLANFKSKAREWSAAIRKKIQKRNERRTAEAKKSARFTIDTVPQYKSVLPPRMVRKANQCAVRENIAPVKKIRMSATESVLPDHIRAHAGIRIFVDGYD